MQTMKPSCRKCIIGCGLKSYIFLSCPFSFLTAMSPTVFSTACCFFQYLSQSIAKELVDCVLVALFICSHFSHLLNVPFLYFFLYILVHKKFLILLMFCDIAQKSVSTNVASIFPSHDRQNVVIKYNTDHFLIKQYFI